MVTGIMTEEPPDGLEKLGWMGQGVVDVDVLGICFTSLEKVSVGDYIPNCWVMFNEDIYQPLWIAIKNWEFTNPEISKEPNRRMVAGWTHHFYHSRAKTQMCKVPSGTLT